MKSKRGIFYALIIPAAVAAISLVLFSTCQQGGGSSSGGGHGSSDAVGLSGNWSSGCQPDIGKNGYYFLDNRSFESAIFRTSFGSFSDKDCKTKIMSQVQAGSYEIGTPAEGQSSYPIDLTIGSVMITLHTESLTQSYNDRKFCGGGWELNVERAITREMCVQGAGSESQVDMIYEIFEVKDNTIYFGSKDAEHTGKTAAKRPAVIDINRGYVKI